MSTYNRLIQNLPPYERNATVINEVMNSTAEEIEKVDTKINENNNELFLDTASKTLPLHERDLNIVNSEVISNERRQRIIQGRYKSVLQQTTDEVLKATCESFAPATVDISPSDVKGVYNLVFNSENGLPNDTDAMMTTLDEAIPAHLDYTLQYIMIGRTSRTTASATSSIGEVVTIYPKSN